MHKNCSCFRNCFTVGMLRDTDIDLSLLVRGELKDSFVNVSLPNLDAFFCSGQFDA